MNFTKAHNNGNDFVILYNYENNITKNQIKNIADRNFGVGCDQVILLSHISNNKYKILFFNSDGSAAKMCGNGASASTKYIHEKLNNKYNEYILEIDNIEYKSSINNELVNLFFNKPIFLSENIISTGNKHLISDISLINNHKEIIKKNKDCNIHFIKKVSDSIVEVKTFEKGVGLTKSCGSGAIAVAFYSSSSLSCNSKEITIIQDGGKCNIKVLDDYILLITNPKLVFEGFLYYD